MFKKLISLAVSIAMVASIGITSSVSAKDTSTILLTGVPAAGQTGHSMGDFQSYTTAVGASTLQSDGSKLVITAGADYDVTAASDSCGSNYFRSYAMGTVTPATMAGAVYYEWTVNASASPAFIGIYDKDSAGSWGQYPGRLNYRVKANENHLWNTGLGGSVPVGKDFKIGFYYTVATGAWVAYVDGKATNKTGSMANTANGLGQVWLEASMVGASDTFTIKDIAVYNVISEPNADDELFAGLPTFGLTKTDGGVALSTLAQGTSSIVNNGGNFVIKADCSASTSNYTRVYLNTTAKTTGYLWYEYTVNMSEVPRLIAINARGSGNGPWQYGDNLNYQKANNENHILRTTGATIVPGQDYTFGFLVNLDSKTYTITQDGAPTRLTGNLGSATTDVGMVWFESMMDSADATLTIKNATVKYVVPDEVDADALYQGIPLFGLTNTMNGISMSTVCTNANGATISNPFKSIEATAKHVANNSNYARVYLNGIVNDSDRATGSYLVEYTVKSDSAPRDLGFFSRANGSYPINVHLMNYKSDDEYDTMRTTGEQYDPSKSYTFGFKFNASTGKYTVYQDGVATSLTGKVALMDGSVRTMSDFFFEMQTAEDDDVIEITAIKVSAVEDEPQATLVDSGYGYSSDDVVNSTYYTVQFNDGIANGEATLVLEADTTKPLTMGNIPSISALTKLTWLVVGLTTVSDITAVADGESSLVIGQ